MLHSLFKSHDHIFAGVLAVHVGIAVNAHFVTPFATQKLINGYAVVLSYDVVQRHFYARNSSALSRMSAELSDAVEQFLDV